jgi:hypothetical protein
LHKLFRNIHCKILYCRLYTSSVEGF